MWGYHSVYGVQDIRHLRSTTFRRCATRRKRFNQDIAGPLYGNSQKQSQKRKQEKEKPTNYVLCSMVFLLLCQVVFRLFPTNNKQRTGKFVSSFLAQIKFCKKSGLNSLSKLMIKNTLPASDGLSHALLGCELYIRKCTPNTHACRSYPLHSITLIPK